MRKWRAWSLPLSPLGRLLLKLFREAHLGGPLSRSSKDDAEVGGEGKSHLFPMGKGKGSSLQSVQKQALRQVFPVHRGGRAEGVPRDSCRVETGHGEARDKSDPRLGAGARPLVDFPVGTRDCYRWPWLTLAL